MKSLLKCLSCNFELTESNSFNQKSKKGSTRKESKKTEINNVTKERSKQSLNVSSKSKSWNVSSSSVRSVESTSNRTTTSVRGLIDDLSPTNAGIYQHLCSIPLFKFMNPKMKIEIANDFKFKVFNNGDILINENQETTEFYIIIKGICNVYIEGKLCNNLEKYDYIGEQAFLSSSGVHHTTVKCITDSVECLVLDKQHFKTLKKRQIYFIQRNNNHSIQPQYLNRDSWFDSYSENASITNHSIQSIFSTKPNYDDHEDDNNNNNNNNDVNNNDINIDIQSESDEHSLNKLINKYKIKQNLSNDISNWIQQQLKNHVLFQGLFTKQLKLMTQCFIKLELNPMECINNEKDKDSLFLVEKGSVTEWHQDTINKVYERGQFFGSENIIFGSNKTEKEKKIKTQQSSSQHAQLQTFEETTIYKLNRETYKVIMVKLRKMNQIKIQKFLRKIPLFSSLLNHEIKILSSTLIIKEYCIGEILTNKGDKPSFWYLIMKGIVNVCDSLLDENDKNDENDDEDDTNHSDDNTDENTEDIRLKSVFGSKPKLKNEIALKAKDYFGETELIYNTKCRKTIVAETNVCCLCIDADEFKHVLGPFKSLLNRGIAAEILSENNNNDDDEKYDNYHQSRKGSKYSKKDLLKQDLKQFKLGPFVGKGKYAQVRLIKHKKTKDLYALKCIHKSFIFSKSGRLKKYCLKVLFNERDGLRQCSIIGTNTFVTKLFFTMTDDKFVYLGLECGIAGDFTSLLVKKESFSEKHSRFYVGQLILAIYHLHSIDLVHRDIKPDNLVITDKGYLRLTDLGFTKRIRKGEQTFTLCGTIGYIAPEIVLEKGYNKSIDWFAVGCFLFHILTGIVPFPSKIEQFDILRVWCQSKHKNDDDIMIKLPNYLSKNVTNLLSKFLQYKPIKRWGNNLNKDINKIKKHPWFEGFDWNNLSKELIKPPQLFPINKKVAFDTKYFNKYKLRKAQSHKYRNFKVDENFKNWDKDF